jgi:hypothetical protein
LGANLAGVERPDHVDNDDDEDPDELSTSGVSTVNSTKLKIAKPTNEVNIYISEQLKAIRNENQKLMEILVDSQKSFQNVLNSTIVEQNLSKDIMKNFTTQTSQLASVVYDRSVSLGYVSDFSSISADGTGQSTISPDGHPDSTDGNANVQKQLSHKQVLSALQPQKPAGIGSCEFVPPVRMAFTNSAPCMTTNNNRKITFSQASQQNDCSPPIDLKLNEWLIKMNFDQTTRQTILNEEFSYEDFLYETDKEDIRRIGLK